MTPNADDDALEVAMDDVLWRWGIPANVGTRHALNAQADRGDLASDLADAARAYWTGILDAADAT